MEYSITRIEISPELNDLLEQHIQTLIENTGKRYTKKKVLSDLCHAGFEYQKFMELNGTIKEAIHGIKQEASVNKEDVTDIMSEINAIQDALIHKEKRLRIKEKYLDKGADRINAQHLSTLQLREEATEMKVNALNFKSYRSPDDPKIEEIIRTLDELKRENSYEHRQMDRQLSQILSNTKKEYFKDTLLPLITPIIAGYGLLNDKNKEVPQEMEPKIKEALLKIAGMDTSKNGEITIEIRKLLDSNSNSGTKKSSNSLF